jgi:acetoin utilization protein AcuB
MAAKKTKARKAPSKNTPRQAQKVTKRKSALAGAPTVAQFMTSSVHTIGSDQPLSHAHEMMNRYRIRHLPVLDQGELMGIVSQRDLYFVESLGDTPPAEIRVEEAMTQDVFEAAPDTPLAEVASTMIKRKLGSAVVTRGGKVVGVFSIIDGLKALVKYLPDDSGSFTTKTRPRAPSA